MLRKMKVLGLGNSAFCDDAIGIEVARRLKGPWEVAILDNPSLTDILDALDYRGFLVVIDSMLGLDPGRLKLVDLKNVGGIFPPTSHDVSLAEAISLKRFQGRDVKGWLIGIGVERIEPGFGISRSLDVDVIARDVKDLITSLV